MQFLPMRLLPIDIAGLAVLFWLALGLLGLLASARPAFINRMLFPLSAAGSLVLAATGIAAMDDAATVMILPLGLPDLPFHLRLDALSGFFLFLLGAAGVGVSLYSAGYFRDTAGPTLGLLCLEYHVFIASMAVVMLADDAYLFMVAWETMALSSYFLVTTEHDQPQIRHAGFLYLLIAHVGAVAILLAFGVLQGGHGDYSFAALRAAHLTPGWASAAFVLALVGFGAKAGILPVHVWLPEAHPAAPSPVSALMSGVMLKTAIYGFVRVVFDLVHQLQWQWGVVVLIVATLTTLFGVLFALMQHDLKRLLAYHSVENIGIILIGLGLALIYAGSNHPVLAALAMIAGLYHTLNHAVFKGLLFLGAGSILHATGERDLGEMGGLARSMPYTAFFFLVGALSISALPPLNGFVSEWLTFQAALLSPALANGILRSLIPFAAAALALAGALTGMCFVKVYGVAFLGAPRSAHGLHAHDAGFWEKLGMGWLAALCVALGLAPVWLVERLEYVTERMVGARLGAQALKGGWLWLAPVAAERASYSPVIFLLVIAAVVTLTFLAVRRIYHGRLRLADPWDCGFPLLDARMQDTPAGFSQPIRHIFAPVYEMERHLPAATDPDPYFSLEIRDRFWRWLYRPVAAAAEFSARQVGRLQQGRIAVYLLYSFVTLLFVLLFVR
ncbi:MAG: hydrogenase 4 subunit B [Betaproteobacteria bacterium CG2_30_68_42]|nr:MAG: hydrogenase 4 subunit B [Betaproteobacteria bacterium CG2_30_68_42]